MEDVVISRNNIWFNSLKEEGKEKVMNWANNLATTDRKQGMGKLIKKINGVCFYCCLGVLDEIEGHDPLYGKPLVSFDDVLSRRYISLLRNNVKTSCPFDPNIAIMQFENKKYQISASKLNDNIRGSFKQIAKILNDKPVIFRIERFVLNKLADYNMEV